MSHKIDFPKVISITYTYTTLRGSELSICNDFKTAHGAAVFYAQQWSNKRWAHLPRHPDDGKQDIVERRVKKIFKQYLP